MTVVRFALGLGMALASVAAASPAAAQFFMQSKDFRAAPSLPDEAGLGQALPGATPDEYRAAISWKVRSALNVAALQCQFEPTLLTVANYNALLADHKDELQKAFDTLAKYFARTTKTKKEGQQALDQFGTRTYSSFATVAAQYGFCQTANSIGREAIFAPRGSFSAVALERIGELRNSLVPFGEQRFARTIGRDRAYVPRLDPICWNKKGEWQMKKCGAQNWPALYVAPAAATVAGGAGAPAALAAQ